MKIFEFFKKKKQPEIIQLEQKNTSGFWCHHCNKTFEIIPSKVYQSTVRALYQDYFFPAKAYLCPHCHKENIIG